VIEIENKDKIKETVISVVLFDKKEKYK